MTATASLGGRLDEIIKRMDAAYVARRQAMEAHGLDSPQYREADEALEAIYVDLRAWNAEAVARVGITSTIV